MRKLLIINFVAILGLASCKRVYTCECTVTYVQEDGTSSEEINEEPSKEKMSKKNAESDCNKGDTDVTNVNGVQVYTECELK